MEKIEQVIGNEIENAICVPFHNLQRHQMSEEMTMLMMGLLMSSNPNKGIESMAQENDSVDFLYKVFKSRAQQFSYTFEDESTPFFLALQAMNPGMIMLYLWYLQYWCKENKTNSISFSIMIEKIFPLGFPSNQDLRVIWDAQKVRMNPDNMVDHPQFGKSLF